MLKFIVLFFAAFAVFSPLFLIGIRKYTGRRAKRALGANIASFFAFLVLASVVGIGGQRLRRRARLRPPRRLAVSPRASST